LDGISSGVTYQADAPDVLPSSRSNLDRQKFAAVDKTRTMILPLHNPSPVGRERVPKAGEGMSRAGVR